MLQSRDGSSLWWGTTDAPGPGALVAPGVSPSVVTAVSPINPAHVVSLDYRIDGGPIREVPTVAQPRSWDAAMQTFLGVLPAFPRGLVEFVPVLRVAGQPMSPRLNAAPQVSKYRVGLPDVAGAAVSDVLDSKAQRAAPVMVSTAAPGAEAVVDPRGVPRWAWDTQFLGALTATLRREIVGPTPDGLRIDWHVIEGKFVGPGFEATVLPGATDWMRIRPDGVGIVDVQASFELSTGARIFGSYGGRFDLGLEGYARALVNEYESLPPVVVTPTYATADASLQWLNRAQCLGVGRVDMSQFRVEFDVYVVKVGGALNEA